MLITDGFVLTKKQRFHLQILHMFTILCVLQGRDLLTSLMIPPKTFLAFMATLEDHYVKDNPFHNSMHAADVTQSTNVLLNTPALEGVFTPIEICGALFAACIHDVDHPGLTNQFLINSSKFLLFKHNPYPIVSINFFSKCSGVVLNEFNYLFRIL